MAGRLSLLGAGKQAVAPAVWTPLSISGCDTWLDFSDATTMFTDAGTTVVTTDNDLVYQVNDKSGNGHNLVQAESDNRPYYKTSYRNGNDAIFFDALDWMSFSSVTAQTPVTVFTASYRPYNAYGRAILASESYHGRIWGPTGFKTSGSSEKTDNMGIGNNVNMIIVGTHASDGGEFKVYNKKTIRVDGTGNGYYGAFSYLGRLTSSVDGYSSGIPIHIYEILVYNSVLSQSDRETVADYLSTKWAI